MRRRLTPLLALAIVLVVAALCWGVLARPVPERDEPFRDLPDVLAEDARHGWAVATPPHLPGPYRRLVGGAVLGRGPGQSMGTRLRDESGQVTHEVVVRSLPDCDHSSVYLVTADGRRTVAILKRCDPPPTPPATPPAAPPPAASPPGR